MTPARKKTHPVDDNLNTDDTATDTNLDKLLCSGTGGSASKDRENRGRGSVPEKYLVQSFRSTGATRRSEEKSAEREGDWQQRFGSLGLISSEESPADQLFNEEADAKARQRAAAIQARDAVRKLIFRKKHPILYIEAFIDIIFYVVGFRQWSIPNFWANSLAPSIWLI
jgi:hypothetical protein